MTIIIADKKKYMTIIIRIIYPIVVVIFYFVQTLKDV